ncbi:MAG: TerD family protein [Jatrophihabitans sp.]|uniref:TerD family protein n=1 Tax=Jatrophihabitans sp. TaxID=1932789 RepID=UPI003F800462
MSTVFSRGQKSPLSNVTSGTDLYVGIQLEPGAGWDIICFGLDADGKLSDDRYMIFFNQPESPEGSISKLGAQSGDTESFRATLDKVPDGIATLSFCAANEGTGTAKDIGQGYLRIVAGGEEVLRYPFTGADFTSERAIIIGNVYRKSGVWRVSAEGQGFAGGLGALVRSYGGTVDDEPEAPPAPTAAPGFAPPPAAPAAPAAAPGSAPPPAAAAPAPGFAPPPAPAPAFAPPPAAAMPPAAPPAAPQYPPQAPPQPLQPPMQPPLQPPLQPPGQPQQPLQPPQGIPPQQPAAGAPAGGGAAPFNPDAPSQSRPTPPGAMVTLTKYKEKPTTGRWTQQSEYLVKVTLGAECWAKRGAMVAYQGDIDFGFKGPGNLKDMFEHQITGQRLKLMTCKGQGEVFLANEKHDLHIVDLNGRTICVASDNVLALDTTLDFQIRRMESAGLPGGGFYFFEISGNGTVVVMSQGPPLTLPVQGPTYADINAVVAWSAGQRVSITSQVRVARTYFTGTSGETYNMQFMAMQGQHFVVVEPFEV